MNTRFTYRDIPLTTEEARVRQARRVESARAQLEHRLNQVKEAEDELRDARNAEPDTHRREQIALQPGDPGYDEAPAVFHAPDYLGETRWLNSPPPEFPLVRASDIENPLTLP